MKPEATAPPMLPVLYCNENNNFSKHLLIIAALKCVCSLCGGVCACMLIVSVEAACARYVWLSIHPYLTDDPLSFLQPLCSLQLLGGGEDVCVECALEAPVSPCGQVRARVPVGV